MSKFTLQVKSTLDKILKDLANSNGYLGFDIDGSALSADMAESTDPAIVWSFHSLEEDTRDPFYRLQFEAAARTADDVSQYGSVGIQSLLQSTFAVGESFYVMDYSGVAAPTQVLGEVIISKLHPGVPVFDNTAGIRGVMVVATVQRFPI